MSDAELHELRQMAEEGDSRLALKLGQYLRIFPDRGAPGEFARWLAIAAQGGQGEACWDIAEMFLFGRDVPRDLGRAREFLALGASLDHPVCQYNLGVMVLNGDGIAADPVKAFELFDRAAAGGEPNAWYNLGICHARGIGTTVDLGTARHWLRKAADGGDPRAAPVLAQIDQAEAAPPTVTVNLDTRQAADLMRNLANAQARAQFAERQADHARAAAAPPPLPAPPTLAERAAGGEIAALLETAEQERERGHFELAAKWLQQAAAAGSPQAHYRLGQYFGCGGIFAARAESHRADLVQAHHHLQAASLGGIAAATSALAQVDRIISDTRERMRAVQARADGGEVAAQFELAVFLLRGEVAAIDAAAALHYFELSARQGLAKAQFAIYHLFLQKLVPDLERKRAVQWLAKAVLQQHREAIFWFAEHYSKGRIEPTDHPLAPDLFADCRKHYPECRDPAQPPPSLEQLQVGAKQQRLESMYLLALRFADGDGVTAAPANAVALLKQCIARGYAPAQYALARICAMGAGVERDMEQAKSLALAAARQGHVPAFIELRMFGATPEEIAAVDRVRS